MKWPRVQLERLCLVMLLTAIAGVAATSTSSAAQRVRVASPADGTIVSGDDDLPIETELLPGTEPDDVNGVTFLLDGKMIFGGQDWSYPFSRDIAQSDLTAGTHEIAVHTQLADGTTDNDTIQFSVGSEAAGQVAITSPADGAVFGSGERIDITTQVSAATNVSAVEFSVDGEMIFGGMDWSAPFSRSVDGDTLTQGTHTVEILARTDTGEEFRDSVGIEVRDGSGSDTGDTDSGTDTGGTDTVDSGGTGSDDGTLSGGDASAPTDDLDADGGEVADPAVCVADVTWGPGGDFDPARGDRLQDAFVATPEDGTLGVLPGTHAYAKEMTFIWARLGGGSKKICGTGEKPTIRGPAGTKWSFGSFGHLTLANLKIDTIAVAQGDREMDHFHADNVDFLNAPSECLHFGWAPQLNEGPGQWESDPLTDSFVTLTNVSFKNCASPAQDDHALYLDRRGCVFRARNIHFEHLGNLEGFRSLCRVSIVTDSFFTNVVYNEDGTRKQAPNGREHGAAPVDFAACSAYILENNEFDIYGEGTVSAIAPRQRRSITSCDMPNWSPESERGKFWDRNFWADVNAKSITDPSNPHIFPLFLANNTVRFTYIGDSVNRSTAVIDFGTYPRQLNREEGCCSTYREVPKDDPATPENDGWVERSVTFSANNRYLGDWWQIFRGGGDLGLPAAKASDPDALSPPVLPTRKFVQIGGDDTPQGQKADIALPAWWPHSCEDLEATYTGWWDEPGDHTGFPPCS